MTRMTQQLLTNEGFGTRYFAQFTLISYFAPGAHSKSVGTTEAAGFTKLKPLGETLQQRRWGSPGLDQQGFIQGGSGNTEHLRGGTFGTPQGGGDNKHALKVPPWLKLHSYRSLNMFKSCLVEHGVNFLSFMKAAN